jgi:hypothetical protein
MRSFSPLWNLPKLIRERETFCALRCFSCTQFQDPSNKIIGLPALSVLWGIACKISLCACYPATSSFSRGLLALEARLYSFVLLQDH